MPGLSELSLHVFEEVIELNVNLPVLRSVLSALPISRQSRASEKSVLEHQYLGEN